MTLTVRPTSLRGARDFVRGYHRHHKPPTGHKFSLAVFDGEERLCGVAIVGRPVSRVLDDGKTWEVTRTCTDGTPNANSCLYGAAAREARKRGATRLITYTLQVESGASLRAAGWTLETDHAGGGEWTCPSRLRKTGQYPTGVKKRWTKSLI